MNLLVERNTKVFNTPLEIGLRTLFILCKFSPATLSLESLVYLDYFTIHSGDIKSGPKSLHPKYPFRSSEIIIKREILQKGLTFLLSKELIEVKLSNEGIKYSATKIGVHVESLFDSNYSKNLRTICDWVYNHFSSFTDKNLKDLADLNIEKWGGEFSNESKFRS